MLRKKQTGKNKKQRLAIYLPQELLDWVEEQAEARSICASTFVRQVLRERHMEKDLLYGKPTYHYTGDE